MAAKPEVGERVKVEKDGTVYEGIVLPTTKYEDRNYLALKLDSGYNIGIKVDKGVKITKVGMKVRVGKAEAKVSTTPRKGLPKVVIISTGGTIASRVDYTIGGVIPEFTTKDLLLAIPEIKELANIEGETLFSLFSENIGPKEWQRLAKHVEVKANDESVDGIIITHGTDTMHYSAAALSFMLPETNVPVVFVGAQRSSDRPSSDAAMNLLSAVYFAASANTQGVFLAMHEKMDDDACLIHRGTRARKMHSSRRDAFRSINAEPVARVEVKTSRGEIVKKNIEWLDRPAKIRQRKRVKADIDLEENVAFTKIFPSITTKQFQDMLKGQKGVVIEGTGLGHVPHRLIPAIERFIKAKNVVVMATQTIHGRVNMNVYETGRELIHAGVISGADMTPETAYVKLMWVLAHAKDRKEAGRLMKSSLAGEITDRIIVEEGEQ